MNQFDPLYLTDHDDDPAQHVAVDGDLLDIRLVPDAPQACDAGDWRSLCDDNAQPMTPEQERAFWWHVACTLAAQREAAVLA